VTPRAVELGTQDRFTDLHHLWLSLSNLKRADLAFIAVAKGPGSFTELIEVVIARTLAQQPGIFPPVCHLNSGTVVQAQYLDGADGSESGNDAYENFVNAVQMLHVVKRLQAIYR